MVIRFAKKHFMKMLDKFRILERSGFTLIELLIVVSILGILSGVLYVVINPESIRGTARDSVRLSNVRKLVEAIESYANMEGMYPEDKDALIGSTYLANWPTDEPLSGDSYTYTYYSPTDSFEVYTKKSDSRYYVYPSDEGRIMDCPTDTYTPDCGAFGTEVETENYSEARSEMRDFMEAVQIAESMSGKVLGQITGTWSSEYYGGCRSGADLKNIPESDPCYLRWVESLDRISAAAGGIDLSGLRRDPWGSPYLLDENEFEWSWVRCRLDRIMTAGPNGIWESSGDGLVGMVDGSGFLMPFASSECAD